MSAPADGCLAIHWHDRNYQTNIWDLSATTIVVDAPAHAGERTVHVTWPRGDLTFLVAGQDDHLTELAQLCGASISAPRADLGWQEPGCCDAGAGGD